ncbi:YggS family pyridoxal phosphate-dependent enzyme [Macrococcoides caseolyticum]|uniref:YggS family pyridoxal phosphate-dependent enzyme n=1 Tax=Macrococcoides caseolyticum TaxID=69966 RepID=UPI001F18AA05|nr:YggS family pyridoxal phosphate-dependent enzyme [Macrococcus caseolyticus]MCE4956866.1 YggS family pyridoxal phosphate-dependent enzyme [Macrococcus caseolyticus]
MSVKDNLQQIQSEINDSIEKSPYQNTPTLIAVTKYVTMERAQEAIDAGIMHLGENRIEGFLEKRHHFNDVTMHFIGSLQTRKVKDVIHHVDYLHSLDRISLAQEINKRAEKKVKCFIQVNVSGEESKHGIPADEVYEFTQSLSKYDKIEVVGLMTMAPLEASEDEIRSYFKQLKQLQMAILALGLPHAPCTETSMGMSNDYKIAIEEGATFIRIGTKLVG